MMNSAFEYNYKIIVKTFRIILETLRRRVWIIGMIIQGVMQVLCKRNAKRIVTKWKNGNQKWKKSKSKSISFQGKLLTKSKWDN